MRISPKEALKHPWFKKASTQSEDKEYIVDKRFLKRLENFQNLNNFK